MNIDIEGTKTETVTIAVDSSVIISDLYRTWKNSIVPKRAYIRDGKWTQDDKYGYICPLRPVTPDEQSIIDAFELIKETIASVKV